MLDRDQIAAVFARAREADIVAVAGTPLFRAGRRMRGECPLCSASKGKKIGGAFSCEPASRMFYCFGCLVGGDVIDLEQRLRGGTGLEAAVRLAGMPVPTSNPMFVPRAPAAARAETSAERLGQEIWLEASTLPINEQPGADYFKARGVRSEVYGLASRRLRFNPSAKWGWDSARAAWLRTPAIVGRVVTHAGPTGGFHVTYLAKDCTRKARLDPAKRMWGPQKDSEGRAGGVWLSDPRGPGPLIVAEGIESGFSAAMLYGKPCRVLAALSLGALQGGWMTDAYGRIDPTCVTGDPEKPALTWPGQDEVIIAVDMDMSPIKVKIRKAGGGTVSHALGAEERAKICGGLAAQAWKAAGAKAVRVIAPGAGRDFNDELMGRLV